MHFFEKLFHAISFSEFFVDKFVIAVLPTQKRSVAIALQKTCGFVPQLQDPSPYRQGQVAPASLNTLKYGQ